MESNSIHSPIFILQKKAKHNYYELLKLTIYNVAQLESLKPRKLIKAEIDANYKQYCRNIKNNFNF